MQEKKEVLIDFNGKKHYLQYPGKSVWTDLSLLMGQTAADEDLPSMTRICAAIVAICLSKETMPKIDVDVKKFKYDLLEYGDKVREIMLNLDISLKDIQDAGVAIAVAMPEFLSKEVLKTENFTKEGTAT